MEEEYIKDKEKVLELYDEGRDLKEISEITRLEKYVIVSILVVEREVYFR